MKYYIDLLFIIIFSIWFRFKKTNYGTHILVIQLVAMGDMIFASSFFRILKGKTYKPICVVCHKKYYDLYNKNNPYVDKWILFDDTHRSIIGKYKFFKELSSYNISTTFDITGGYFSKWLGYSTSSKLYGIDLRESGFNFLYDHYVKPNKNTTHIVDTYLKLLDISGTSL